MIYVSDLLRALLWIIGVFLHPISKAGVDFYKDCYGVEPLNDDDFIKKLLPIFRRSFLFLILVTVLYRQIYPLFPHASDNPKSVIEPNPNPNPNPVPVPVPVPNPVPDPESKVKQEIKDSNKRISDIISAAEKWRSRTGPIHENLVDLLGSITAYDQNRFDKQPEAKEAWDYLQSIQKIINEKSIGITAENKNNISINVVVTGTNDIGDRAARALEEWLEENGFNTDKNNTDIYIDVDGVQSSSPRPYTTYSATTSLNLIARWLDGSRAFEIHIPPLSKSGGGRDDAEDRSFSDAVAKMISSFQAHVHQ